MATDIKTKIQTYGILNRYGWQLSDEDEEDGVAIPDQGDIEDFDEEDEEEDGVDEEQ